MQLSTRGRYAIMAMLDLATMHAGGSPTGQRDGAVTLAMIAERQQISLSYLEQLFAKLRKGGVVSSQRGPGGGYTLPRPASQILLAQIIDAVDEDIDLTRCGSMHEPQGPALGAGCVHGAKCNAHDLWGALGRHMEQFFKQVTLQMVLDGTYTAQFGPQLGASGTAELPNPLRVVIN